MLAPRKPLSVDMTTTVGEVLQLMVSRAIGCVVVTESDKMVGIFTERDALLRLNVDAAQLSGRPVREFMTKSPDTITSDAPIAFAPAQDGRRRLSAPARDGRRPRRGHCLGARHSALHHRGPDVAGRLNGRCTPLLRCRPFRYRRWGNVPTDFVAIARPYFFFFVAFFAALAGAFGLGRLGRGLGGLRCRFGPLLLAGEYTIPILAELGARARTDDRS